MADDTSIDVIAEDEGDVLTEPERCALHEALSKFWVSATAGHRRPATESLDELRQRRSR